MRTTLKAAVKGTTAPYATTTGVTLPGQSAAPAREPRAERPAPVGRVSKVPPALRRLARMLAALSGSPTYAQYEGDPPPCDRTHQTPQGPPFGRPALLSKHAPVRDLRDRSGRGPRGLVFGPRDLVVVTGLPGSGKSTFMDRTVHGIRVDSQHARDRWAARLPRFLPYALYRPAVRLAHYAGLRRALRTGEGVVVHDCGSQAWVRGWLAREARRRGATLHLLLLDVDPHLALAGQRTRGRGVSRYAFLRHRRSTARLLRAVERGDLPEGCGSAVLLDRDAADAVRRLTFTG